MSFRELEHARFVEEPMTPEKVLGLTPHANIDELEEAYVNRRQALLDELEAGKRGDGSRVVPQAEYEQRMAQIEQAYQSLKQLADEEREIDTQELDPDFPNRIK